jgi:hypothetical protein
MRSGISKLRKRRRKAAVARRKRFFAMFKRLALALIPTIGSDLVPVQKMDGPPGILFYLDYPSLI